MIRPISCSLSIFIISLQVFSAYGGSFTAIADMKVSAQNSVLKIYSFKDTFLMFMSQKKNITDQCTLTMPKLLAVFDLSQSIS